MNQVQSITGIGIASYMTQVKVYTTNEQIVNIQAEFLKMKLKIQ